MCFCLTEHFFLKIFKLFFSGFSNSQKVRVRIREGYGVRIGLFYKIQL